MRYPLQACDAGKFRKDSGATADSDCEDCEAGKYSDAAGSTVCMNCAAGKYLEATGGASAAACTSCGANANSAAASDIHTDCSCNAGYYGAALTAAGTSMTCTVIIRSVQCCMLAAGVKY